MISGFTERLMYAVAEKLQQNPGIMEGVIGAGNDMVSVFMENVPGQDECAFSLSCKLYYTPGTVRGLILVPMFDPEVHQPEELPQRIKQHYEGRIDEFYQGLNDFLGLVGVQIFSYDKLAETTIGASGLILLDLKD